MEEEEKKEAIEKTGVDYDKLKEIISTVYPVRYERRTAIAPVLWICGAMFTTSLIWCTVNMGLTNDSDYKKIVMWLTLIVAGLSFAAALFVVYKCLTWKKHKSKGKGKDEGKDKGKDEGKDEGKDKGKDKDKDKDEYEPCWDLLRSEHFLLEMRKMDIQIDGRNYGKPYGETGDDAPSNTVDDGTKKEN